MSKELSKKILKQQSIAKKGKPLEDRLKQTRKNMGRINFEELECNNRDALRKGCEKPPRAL